MQDGDTNPEELPKDITIPNNLSMTARGFGEENRAIEAVNKLHSVISVISQQIDLTDLDGVTIAFDYDEALAELDRGYETKDELEATKDIAIGVAMSPRVIRDGQIKTHIVLNANYTLGILEEPGEETDSFRQALHLIAHECAHVEVTAAFDKSFPNTLLQKKHKNFLDSCRWQVIQAIWDEYAVCRTVGTYGYDPTDWYLETLGKVLEITRDKCYKRIKAYRIHDNSDQVVAEVYGLLGDLLKFAAYFLGAVSNRQPTENYPSALTNNSDFDWFKPFYEQIIRVNEALWSEFGSWANMDSFEAIGNTLEEMAESIGIKAIRISEKLIKFDIPYRTETMPGSIT